MASKSARIRNYLARAEQCRAWADLSRHEASKDEFLRVAAQWKDLADEVERIERVDTVALGRREPTHPPVLS